MALDYSALLSLLSQLKDTDLTDRVRTALERVYQELIDAEGSDAGLGDSFSHATRATGVAIMVSNSMGVKRPNAACQPTLTVSHLRCHQHLHQTQ
jgi:hypothetical protein